MKSPRRGQKSAPKKARWTRAQKIEAQRAKVRKQVGARRTSESGGRPAREDRDRRDERTSRRDERYRGDRRSDDRPSDDRRSDDRRRNDRRSDDRRSRDERSRPGRDDRRADRGPRRDDRADRPRQGWRDDRPRREERPRGDERRDDRGPRQGSRDDRPRRDQGSDQFRDDRRSRDDRPRYQDRPRHDRDDRRDRPRRDDRPSREHSHRDRFGARAQSESLPEPQSQTDERPDVRREPATTARDTGADGSFADLGLPDVLIDRLARDGITSPFPIQQATIPDAMSGRDVLGRGRTGSGKTLSFGLPTIARLAAGGRARPHHPRAIVLTPTRELAMQVSDALMPLVHVAGLRHKLVAGGMPYEPQLQALQRGVDLLIATPGRLMDLMERGAADLSRVEIAILDEADHMAEMGFLEAITEILDAIPEGGQRLLFSATLDRGIDTVVDRYLIDPVTHSTDDGTASIATMQHHALLIDPQHKKVVTAEVANRTGRTIVFCRTKLGADRVAAELRDQGVVAAALHGGLNQGQRNKVLGAFKDGRVPVLVATDVAARGIHVDDVGVVLQVDPPADHKDYLHRAGRTARAGESGTVVTLALPHQRRTVQRLLDDAGAETTLRKASPGDEVIEAAGGSTPESGPISDDDLYRLLSPRRGRDGRSGGRRPYGERSGRPDRRGGRYDDRREGGRPRQGRPSQDRRPRRPRTD